MPTIYIVQRGIQQTVNAELSTVEGDLVIRKINVPDRGTALYLQRHPGDVVPERIRSLIERLIPSLPRSSVAGDLSGFAGKHRAIGG